MTNRKIVAMLRNTRKLLKQRGRFQEQMSCAGKIRHANKNSAVEACAAMNGKTGDTINAYECVYCHGWHIGNTKNYFVERDQ